MFSLWNDFTLGVAGVGDLLGITEGAAAAEWAEQEAEANGLDDGAAAELEAKAREVERSTDLVRKAAASTAEKVAAPVLAFGAWLKWTLWGLALAIAGGFGFYLVKVYAPKPKGKG